MARSTCSTVQLGDASNERGHTCTSRPQTASARSFTPTIRHALRRRPNHYSLDRSPITMRATLTGTNHPRQPLTGPRWTGRQAQPRNYDQPNWYLNITVQAVITAVCNRRTHTITTYVSVVLCLPHQLRSRHLPWNGKAVTSPHVTDSAQQQAWPSISPTTSLRQSLSVSPFEPDVPRPTRRPHFHVCNHTVRHADADTVYRTTRPDVTRATSHRSRRTRGSSSKSSDSSSSHPGVGRHLPDTMSVSAFKQ